jgi:hypothetical protein
MHGQRKHRKHKIENVVEIDGFELCWRLRSEPQWSTEDGPEGLSISVQRTDGAFRELILEYSFPRTRKKWFDGRVYLVPDPLPARPQVSAKTVESDIREAIAAGWNPASRGKAHVYQVLPKTRQN